MIIPFFDREDDRVPHFNHARGDAVAGTARIKSNEIRPCF
jgi:hypothetical protein